MWLEEYLATYKKTLVVISHSQDFLNGVCTDMMVMQQQKLKYWSGNYDTYLKTRSDQEVNQIKLYKKQQVEINDIKQFISSCGTYANLVRQAKSRQVSLFACLCFICACCVCDYEDAICLDSSK